MFTPIESRPTAGFAVIARVALLFAATAASLVAQQPTWKLPLRGAAEYRSTHKARTGVAATRAAALQLDAKDKPAAELLPHLVPSPWLCQGELAADQRAVGDEPRDLRDVMRAVAFDLRLGGASKVRYRRLPPFGDLVLTGKVAPIAADGKQTFDLDVATEEPEVRAGETKASLQKWVRPLCKFAAGGKLAVTRVFDAKQGVVQSFDAELTLVFEEEKGKFRKLVVSDRQELVAIHDNQDAAFRTAVAHGIREGAAWLKRELGDLTRRSFGDEPDKARSYGSGRLALALLTLLHAEVPADDPLIVAGFDELRKRVLIDTYSLSVALMALAERYTPPGEADLLRSGTLPAPRPRQLGEADRKLAQEWLTKLRQNIDTRNDPAYRMAFNYTAGPRFDNSVNQYGMLGLYAASLCDLEIPVTVWRAAAAHQLAVQVDAAGRTLKLDLTTYKEQQAQVANADAPAPKRTRTGGAIPTLGYAYHRNDKPAYGSMTAAGVGTLVISRFGLLRAGQNKADVLPKIDDGIQSGFAWLAAEFHVRSNPGDIEHADDSWYYYLYGLERTCELAGVALLQGRDWYYEGALQILPQQQLDGSFRTERPRGFLLDSTCFAVLFLKKAALPPITGG